MAITYSDKKISVDELCDVIKRSTLKRQIENKQKIKNMLEHADFLYTAWDGNKIVGYTRGITDYGDVVFIDDLGIDKEYWHKGIGSHLIKMVIEKFGNDIHIVLVASKLARDYYAKLGFIRDERGYVKSPEPLDPTDWTV
ncbi:hypothetical protein ATX28_09190 [Oenococcus oeni]|uniref:GNAT family N-acetyltransferase n=1 Tax=Oenococcus oeni TaxID=1247 RepID=UPI0009512EE3|nr:GNAT family N-acetyltransferase [Oenococcus oeni]OLQ38379.1 hypothetical protein ATX28_09190 [Oenococcus oeni]